MQKRNGTLVSPSQKLDFDKDIMLGFFCAHIVLRNNQMVKQCHNRFGVITQMRQMRELVRELGTGSWVPGCVCVVRMLERNGKQFRTQLNTSREEVDWSMDLSFGLEDLPVLFEKTSTEATFPQFKVTWMRFVCPLLGSAYQCLCSELFVCRTINLPRHPITVAFLSVRALIQSQSGLRWFLSDFF